jgi:hypothetical protein
MDHIKVITETLYIVTVNVENRQAGKCQKKEESSRRLNLVWKTGLYVMTNRITLHLCTVCCIYYRCRNYVWIKDMLLQNGSIILLFIWINCTHAEICMNICRINYIFITKWRVSGTCPVLRNTPSVWRKYFERKQSKYNYWRCWHVSGCYTIRSFLAQCIKLPLKFTSQSKLQSFHSLYYSTTL